MGTVGLLRKTGASGAVEKPAHGFVFLLTEPKLLETGTKRRGLLDRINRINRIKIILEILFILSKNS